MVEDHFAPLVTKPTVITKPGLYKTRRGEVVRIKSVSAHHDFGCWGTYLTGTCDGWHRLTPSAFSVIIVLPKRRDSP
jgi:hypothetical protein